MLDIKLSSSEATYGEDGDLSSCMSDNVSHP
jgi:hypothetical protein